MTVGSSTKSPPQPRLPQMTDSPYLLQVWQHGSTLNAELRRRGGADTLARFAIDQRSFEALVEVLDLKKVDVSVIIVD